MFGDGDVDGDGYDEMLVGAPFNYEGMFRTGAACLVLGGTAPASARLSTVESRYVSKFNNGEAGYALSGAGDVDGDGAPDLLIGDSAAGRVYLLLSPGSWSW